MMSFVVQRLNGVSSWIRWFSLARSQLSGSLNGSRPVARSKAPAMVVNGATWWPFSSYPFTAP